MKQVVLFLALLFIGGALADNAPTSVGYVDSQIGTLQNKISAVDNNTVLTHTNTAGEIGQKSIYDATGNYVEQQNALVTAEVANAAVQNAIDTEFVCIEWLEGAEHTNENCLIYDVRAVIPQQILPTGYTALEYIESTGKQYINTVIPWTSVYRFQGTAQQSTSSQLNYAVLGSSALDGTYGHFWGTAYWSAVGISEWYWNTGIPPTTIADFDIHRENNEDWRGTVNGVTTSTLTATLSHPSSWWNFIGNVVILSTNSSGSNRSFHGRVWNIQLFGANNNPIFKGIPARRDSDGKLGMYDLVSNTFFTNSGSGTFTAGPDLKVYLPSGI